MSKWKEYGIPCPHCSSSDAYAVDKEGKGYCFSCKTVDGDSNGKEYNYELTETDIVEKKYLAQRGISQKTFEIYKSETKLLNGKAFETAFPYPELKGAKIRRLSDDVPKNQRYYCTPGLGAPGLFGKHVFDPGSKDSITIVEGMYDALAVYEATNGRTAAVAVTSSVTALRDVKQDYDYVNSFKKIIIAMDGDNSGEDAARSIVSSGLFDYNKLFVVKLNKYKDPTEYLEKNDAFELLSTWKGARRYSPDNIISTFEEVRASLQKSQEDQIGTYPFKRLNDNLYGLHEGEIVVFKGPEGIGKTEVFRAMEHHLLRTTTHNIGIIHLEEDNGTTVKAIAGYELDMPAVLPDCGLSPDEIMAGYQKAVGDNEGRVHIYSSFETEEEDVILDHIRFLVASAGCKFIFLDHISWLATGMQDEDERKKLDRISQRLKLLAKELRFCLIMISHVNDEGKTRGSRNITKVANTVIDLKRDLTSYDEVIKQSTEFTIEKARLGGRTGAAGMAYMDRSIGKLIEVE